MTREEKSNMIADITDLLVDSTTVYITDISGMNALDTSNLRRACHKGNIQLRVVKNTLLQKAMDGIENKEYDGLYDTLVGNTALMISDTGNAPAKLIKTFRKKSKKPMLKAAWVDSAIFKGDDQLDTLENLKSREELIGEIVGLLQSPIKTVVSQLQSGGQTIAGLVKTLQEKPE